MTIVILLAIYSAIAFIGAWFIPKNLNWTLTDQLIWIVCIDIVLALLFVLSVSVIRFCARLGKRSTR